jgi:hypothetical protein
MLPKQTIDIPFTGSLDESSNKVILPPGQFNTFKDCVTTKRGAIQARPAFQKLGTIDTYPARLIGHDGQVLALDTDYQDPALLVHGGGSDWRRIGFYPSVTNERITRLRRAQATVRDADFAPGNSYDVLAFRDEVAGGNKLRVVITNRATGVSNASTIVSDSGDASNIRCTKGAIGSYLLVTWRVAGSLRFVRVNTDTGVRDSVANLVTDSFDWVGDYVWAHDIAAIPGTNNYVVAYQKSGVGGRVIKIESNGNILATGGPSASVSSSTAIAVGSTGVVYMTANYDGAQRWYVLGEDLSIEVNALAITGFATSSVTHAGICYVGDEACIVTIGTHWIRADRYGTFSDSYQTSESEAFISKPFTRDYNGRAYVYLCRNNTHHLVELQTSPLAGEAAIRPVTNAAYQVAADPTTWNSYKMQTVTATETGAVCALPVHLMVQTSSTGDVSDLDEDTLVGFDQLNITWADPHVGQTAVVDGVLHISGGLLCEYDGRSIYENCFVDEPRVQWIEKTSGGVPSPGVSHGWIEVWDWWDAKGRRHQSHPSFPALLTPEPSTLGTLTYSGPGGILIDVDLETNAPTIGMTLKVMTTVGGSYEVARIAWSFDDGVTYSASVPVAPIVALTEYRTGEQYNTGSEVGVRLSCTDGSSAILNLGETWRATQPDADKYVLRYNYDQMTLRREIDGKVACSLYYTGPNGRIYYRAYPFEDYYSKTAYDTLDASISTGLINVLNSIHWGAQLHSYRAEAQTHQQMLYSAPDGSGELPNDAIHGGCTHLVTHGDRLFAASAEFPTRLRYSKPAIPGVPVSFPEGFELDIGERITGLASIGGTLVVFSGRAIFVVYGDGPDATGGGGSFTIPQRLPTEHGCIDARSIAVFEGGVLFRSQRGIMLLDRKYSVQFIGAPVSDKLTYTTTILGVTVIAYLEQVRFMTNSDAGRWLVFDYSDATPRWYVWTHATGITPRATLPTGSHWFLTDEGELWNENPTYAYDNNDLELWRTPSISTGWIHLGKLANFKRLWRVALTCERHNAHGLRFYYQTTEGDTEQVDWTSTDLAATVNSETVVPIVWHIKNQQARAWRFGISALPPIDNGTTVAPMFSWHGLSLQIGVKEQVRKGRV